MVIPLSIALAQTRPRSDINNDGTVNMLDYNILAGDWLEPNRVWLLSRVAELEAQVFLLESSRDITRAWINTDPNEDRYWFNAYHRLHNRDPNACFNTKYGGVW